MFSFSYSWTLKALEYRNLYKLSIMIDNKARGVLYIEPLPENYRLYFPSRTLVHKRCWSTGTYKLSIMIDNKARGVLYIEPLPGNYRLCFPSRTLVHQRCWSTGTYINGYS